MWDMYKDIRLLLAARHFATVATFEIALNGHKFVKVFSFWNYRQWRFWPTIDIPIDGKWLNAGKNVFAIKNLTRPFEIFVNPPTDARFDRENTAYQISGVQVLEVKMGSPANMPTLPDGVLVGHMIGGHETVYSHGEDYSFLVDLFKNTGQGNLVAFMLNPDGTGYGVDLSKIDTAALVRSGLHAIIRPHACGERFTGPEGGHKEMIRDFIRGMGKKLRRARPPTSSMGAMDRIVLESGTTDISKFGAEYVTSFRRRGGGAQRAGQLRQDIRHRPQLLFPVTT